MDRQIVLTDSGPSVAKARQITGTPREKIEQALELCRSSAPVADDSLNMGIAILLRLPTSEVPEEYREIYLPLLGILAWAKAQAPEHLRFAEIWTELRKIGGLSYHSDRWKDSLRRICQIHPDYEPTRFYIDGVCDGSNGKVHVLTKQEALSRLMATESVPFLPE